MKHSQTETRKIGRPLSFDRDAALEKAMLTFWRHGYETTSVSDLTAAMGVTAPSIYTAYGDKKQLFLEAVQLYAGAPEDQERALSEASTAREAAHAMLLAAVATFTREAGPKGCLLASATASGSRDSADVQAAVAEIRSATRLRLERRIDKDVASGILPAGTDAASLAVMVIAVIQGMSVLARDGMDRAMLTALAETAIAAFPLPKAESKGLSSLSSAC